MLRGAGYDRAENPWCPLAERNEMEKLVDAGIVDIGRSYPGDNSGSYYISDEKKEDVRELYKEELAEYGRWKK